MNSLFVKMIAGITGLAIAVYILAPGATYDHNWLTLILAGAALGLLLYFVRPLLYLITLPLRIITFNLFSFVIIMLLVWIVDCLFSTHLEFQGLKNIFFASLIVWAVDLLLGKLLKQN
ncbi:MAG TPA: phage holin family protein [Candidatus Pacearchaeota archaeon]|nr:phage holin family protein [Candidatus Pacearchaeota archaeon]HPC30599.1 phage holin family protein [Candidatus Pacearchaeota archaeon]HQG09163.1 phage holin family protein [Candidatus Pacearchaeota archaeon]HQH20421.1 phage holin family protein [Candidatus Pacearchaeota archaeon]HRR94918.1 phage holin family protein [Candidatus Paceibacterota bacterium]